jgi:hypothetical protein
VGIIKTGGCLKKSTEKVKELRLQVEELKRIQSSSDKELELSSVTYENLKVI